MALANPSPTDWYACVKQNPVTSGTDRNIDGYPMKLPESTTTVRAAGSIPSSSMLSVRGSMLPEELSST